MKLFNFSLLLSRKCNQQCEYCDVYFPPHSVETDLDYLTYVLNLFKDVNLHVELSGGEPGLVTNFCEVLNVLNKCTNVKKFSVLSNGLLRKLYSMDIFITHPKFLLYYEHCFKNGVLDSDKFYDIDLPTSEYIRYVCVLSPQMIKSINDNFDEFISRPYLYYIFFKCLIQKTMNLSMCYKETIDIIKRLEPYHPRVSRELYYTNRIENPETSRYFCPNFPKDTFINLEERYMGHCSQLVEKSKKYDITEDNIMKLFIGKLYNQEDYCRSCYKYINQTFAFREAVKHNYVNMML